MKIAILTQALHSNYGGLLQNYALQQVLRQMGHDGVTIDRHIERKESLLKNFVKWLYRHVKSTYNSGFLTAKQKQRIACLQTQFIKQNIIKTPKLITQAQFDAYVSNNRFDAYIVGSDQCWRPCYSANIKNYFLDFIQDSTTKKVSYAASFGVDVWEYSEALTPVVEKLAKEFDAVSVRERSAVDLCKKHLNRDATWVVDPTMLLGADGFMKFITPDNSRQFVLNYLLEESAQSKALVRAVANELNIDNIIDNLPSPIFKRCDTLSKHTNISVEKWLSNIYNSSFVITDSFHGAVFSILFNKPFIVKLNAVRGNTRLESLLEDFDLVECICQDVEHFKLPTFNWQKINIKVQSRKFESYNFLANALNQ
jgi:hypothetical protein